LTDETLRRAGRELRLGSEAAHAWAGFVRHEATRARRLFDSGLRVIDLIPPSAAACVLTMAGIYQRILTRITEEPAIVWQRRVSLPTATKLKVAMLSWVRALSR
jgi:phytoene synthase